MTLLFMGIEDPNDIYYEGRVVGRMENGADGRITVTLSISYTARPDLAVVPLSWFAYGLALSQPSPKADLTLTSSESDLDDTQGPTLLIEKVLKADGYKWQFHLNDADTWPSSVHGHDYEKGLVLDLFTGEIFEPTARRFIRKLKPKALVSLQGQLRESAGFENKI